MVFAPRSAIGVVLLGIGGVIPVEAPSTPPLRLEKTIELPDVQGRIDHLSIDLKTHRLFMAALGNDTVEVIDLRAGKRVQTIRGLAEPQGILFVPDVNRVFVANGKDGSLRLFDGTSLTTVKAVSFGDDADNLRLEVEIASEPG